jgi:hypothetical protein
MIDRRKNRICMQRMIANNDGIHRISFISMTHEELVKKCRLLYASRIKCLNTIMKLRLEINYLLGKTDMTNNMNFTRAEMNSLIKKLKSDNADLSRENYILKHQIQEIHRAEELKNVSEYVDDGDGSDDNGKL